MSTLENSKKSIFGLKGETPFLYQTERTLPKIPIEITTKPARFFPNNTTPTPSFQLELWGILNEGGNRDAGNDLTYIDENGVTQNQYVGNNGSSFAWLSTTEYAIATATGDPYTIRRLAKGTANIEATGYIIGTGFTFQNEFDVAFAAGESVATVQAEYDAG